MKKMLLPIFVICACRSEAMQQPNEFNQPRRQITIKTNDGLETAVDISTAKLFGTLKRTIDATESIEKIELLHIDKILLDDAFKTTKDVYSCTVEEILKLSDAERRQKVPHHETILLYQHRPSSDALASELGRMLTNLRAAHYLDVPELIEIVASSIAQFLSLEECSESQMRLTQMINQESTEMQNDISQAINKEKTFLKRWEIRR